MNVYEALQNLGLKDKERDAYLGLLELGEGTVAHVAAKANLKRPTTYLIMNALGERGLVSEFKRGKHTYFAPRSPEGLVQEARSRVSELEEVLPQLKSLFIKGKGKPRVIVGEGIDKLNRAYDDLFVIKGEGLFISNSELGQSILEKTFRRADYAVLSKDFSWRELIEDSPTSRAYKERVRGPHRQVRFLPKELNPFESDVSTYGDRVVINSLKEDYFSVSIDSKPIAASFRAIFEGLWGISQE